MGLPTTYLRGHKAMAENQPTDVQLRYFLELTKGLSLTRAAERLGISQPALSQQMRQLENGLGQRVMERHGRGIRLTEAGTRLAELLKMPFEAVDLAVAELRVRQGVSSGRVNIAGVHTLNAYFVPRVLGTFRQAFPDAHFGILGRSSAGVVEAVRRGEAEVGLVYGTFVVHEDLEIHHLFDERLVLTGSPRLVEAVKHCQGRMTVPMVAFPPGYALRQLADRVFGHDVHIAAEVETLDALMGLAGAGVGVGVLPEGVSRTVLAAFGLECLSLPAPQPMRQAVLVHRDRCNGTPPLVRALIDAMREAAKRLKVDGGGL